MRRLLKTMFGIIAVTTIFRCRNDNSRLFTSLGKDRTGIKFIKQLFETHQFNVLNYSCYYNGGGVVVGDIYNDGMPDFLFTGIMVKNRLFLKYHSYADAAITDVFSADQLKDAVY